MDKERKLLKVAGIIECIVGATIPDLMIVSLPLILIGMYLFISSYDDEEELLKNRNLYLIMAIITFLNFISFAIILTVCDNIKKYNVKVNGKNAPPRKIVYKMDSESKKIDILLKLGVGMVFISGILFATTTWDFLNNYIKAFALILLGSLFIMLSIFTEEKLGLYRSSYMYWLLGISFFILTIVGMLYFGIFGSYLTYSGAGKYLAYGVTLLSSSGFIFATYLKYPKKHLLHLSYFTLMIAVYNIVMCQSQDKAIAICILTAIVTIINLINRKENNLSKFLEVISYPLLVTGLFLSEDTTTVLFITAFLNIVNMNYHTMTKKYEELSVTNMIATYFIFTVICSAESLSSNGLNIPITIIFSGIYTLLINSNLLNCSKTKKEANYAIYSLLMVLLFIFGRNITFTNEYNLLLISTVFLLITLLSKKALFGIEKIDLTNYIEPIPIFLLIKTIGTEILVDFKLIGVTTIIYTLIFYLSKEKLTEKIYYIFSLIGLIVVIYMRGISTNSNDLSSYIAGTLSILSALLLFIKTYTKDKDNNPKLVISYLTLLVTVYFHLIIFMPNSMNKIILSILFIALIFFAQLALNEKNIKMISQLFIIAPLFTIINESNFNYTFREIMTSITLLYGTLLVSKYLAKDVIAKNIIIIVGLALFLTTPLFLESIYGGIYVGIVGLIIIGATLSKDNYNPLFITGIVITILNIAYRLRAVWKLIPFWLYLLLGGLLIIGFVTAKEIKKK